MKNITKSLYASFILLITTMLSGTAMAATYDDPYGTTGMDLFAGAYCLIVGIGFLINILILIWVYKDAKKRGASGALWVIIVLITGIIGLIIWLVVRPPLQPVMPYGQPQYQQPYQAPPQQGYYQQPPPQPQQPYQPPPQDDPYRRQ